MIRKFVTICFFLFSGLVFADNEWVKGIYISQNTLENTHYLQYLIQRSKEVGINTFIIDFNRMNSRYRQNIQLVKDNRLHYVARIVVFPDGGTHQQISSESYWEKRFELVKQALSLGAEEIQLDYIRYNTKNRPSSENAKNVYKVIKWFKHQLKDMDVSLQVAVFGVTSFGEAHHIGQNIKLFANSVDVLCPMVYPSHYEPYLKHAKQPYETVLSSLNSMKVQLGDFVPFKVYPYIEMSNYRYRHGTEGRRDYIHAQIRAAEQGGAHGWYAWSAGNKYDHLFRVLETRPQRK